MDLLVYHKDNAICAFDWNFLSRNDQNLFLWMSSEAGGSHWCPTSQQLLETVLFPGRAHQLLSEGWWSSFISPEVCPVRGCLGSDSSWLILLALDFCLWWERGRLGWTTLQPTVTYATNFYILFNSRFLPGRKPSSMAVPCAKDGRWGWQPHCHSPKSEYGQEFTVECQDWRAPKALWGFLHGPFSLMHSSGVWP